jgi:peptidoglycan/xylan/chitin deacetylase (PgdA/CDA1 family)
MIRSDRVASLYLISPYRNGFRTRDDDGKIAVLMYHQVSGEKIHVGVPYYDTNTQVDVFKNHLEVLRRENYSVIGMEEASDLLRSGKPFGGNHVVITFDDGFMGVYRHAFPLLCEYGFRATVFLVTSCVGRKSVDGTEFMGWEEAREMVRCGFAIGSHTVDHKKLAWMDGEGMRYQVRASRDTIEQKLGISVKAISYPYAFPEGNRNFRRTLKSLLAEEGYEHGVTTVIGRNGPGADLFFLKRIPVNSSDDDRFFRVKLAGGYDWMRGAQYIFKSVKRFVRTGERDTIRNETFLLKRDDGTSG